MSVGMLLVLTRVSLPQKALERFLPSFFIPCISGYGYGLDVANAFHSKKGWDTLENVTKETADYIFQELGGFLIDEYKTKDGSCLGMFGARQLMSNVKIVIY